MKPPALPDAKSGWEYDGTSTEGGESENKRNWSETYNATNDGLAWVVVDGAIDGKFNNKVNSDYTGEGKNFSVFDDEAGTTGDSAGTMSEHGKQEYKIASEFNATGTPSVDGKSLTWVYDGTGSRDGSREAGSGYTNKTNYTVVRGSSGSNSSTYNGVVIEGGSTFAEESWLEGFVGAKDGSAWLADSGTATGSTNGKYLLTYSGDGSYVTVLNNDSGLTGTITGTMKDSGSNSWKSGSTFTAAGSPNKTGADFDWSFTGTGDRSGAMTGSHHTSARVTTVTHPSSKEAAQDRRACQRAGLTLAQ